MPIAELDTNALTITFHINPSKFNHRVTVFVVMTSNSIDRPYGFKSSIETVEKENIHALCRYLLQHCLRLRFGSTQEAKYPYMDYDYLYRVYAQSGRYDAEQDDVYFSILFLLYLGRSERPGNVFMGGDCSVTGQQITKFTQDLQNAVAEADQMVYVD